MFTLRGQNLLPGLRGRRAPLMRLEDGPGVLAEPPRGEEERTSWHLPVQRVSIAWHPACHEGDAQYVFAE